jgi:uncharacterized protein (DUF1330 family)
MGTFVIFDVEIHNLARYQEFMTAVNPTLAAAGTRYLARGDAHRVYEGDWHPRRLVILEFPSTVAWKQFYEGPVYRGLKAIRDECSSARLVSVEGLPEPSASLTEVRRAVDAHSGNPPSPGTPCPFIE